MASLGWWFGVGYMRMAKTSPARFIQEVRQEVKRVAWPSRKETGVSTAMVFAMVIFSALFFFVVDQILAFGVKTIFGFGG